MRQTEHHHKQSSMSPASQECEGDDDPKAKVLEMQSALTAAKYELAMRVKHYESKLTTMTVINSALQNENEKLKEEVLRVPMPAGTQQELAELQEEFTKRLGIAERTALSMKDECSTLRQQVEDLKKSRDLVTQELEEKQSSIDQYVMEGEKLSIKIGELEGILKRCRADLVRTDQEKEKYSTRVQVLEAAAKEADLNRSMDVEEANLALQNTRQLLAEQKESFTQALEEVKKNAEEDLHYAREEASSQISQMSQKMEERERIRAVNIDALRMSLTNTTKAASEREDLLREEVKRLELRCRKAEAAHEEATARLTEATMPLLRQMEGMSIQCSQKEALMEERERQHSAQMQEMERAFESAMEAFKKAEAGALSFERRANIAQSTVIQLRAETRTLAAKLQDAELEVLDMKEKLLEAAEKVAISERAREDADLQLLAERTLREESQRLLKESKLNLSTEAEELRSQIQLLKDSLEAQKKDFTNRLALLTTPTNADDNVDTASSGSSTSTERFSVASSKEFASKRLGSSSDMLAGIIEMDSARGGQSMNHIAMERLVAQVRRFQGEVAQLHKDLKAAQTGRDHATEDLLKVTEKLNALEKANASALKVKKELEELKRRHDMALVIIGEQNEKADELEADMADVKALYREQMNFLISQVDPDKWPEGYRICLFCSHCAQVQRRTKRFGVK